MNSTPNGARLTLLTYGLLAVAGFATPVTASAVMVTWQATGTIDSIVAVIPDELGTVNLGDPFVVTWSFDTHAPLLATRDGIGFAPGKRYEYEASSLEMWVLLGSNPPRHFTYDMSSAALIWLRDDAGDQRIDGQPVDGITFDLQLPDIGRLTVFFRGTDLSMINGPGLPKSPYPGIESSEVRTFALGPVGSRAVAEVLRITVPEPGSLALFSLALIGVGVTRRRRVS
jgi:hypothetical protein